VGLRPGEKLYEELFSENEPMMTTHHPKINIAQVADDNFETIFNKIEKMLGSLNKMSESMLIEEMLEIVPGYTTSFVATPQEKGLL
jgi:FlaA1/EpsC-like NDP-sugar epimerase